LAGLTLDSGALIQFERRDRSVMAQLKAAALMGINLTVPSVVVAEVWRGGARSAPVAALLSGCEIDAVDDTLARRAGEALGRVRRADTVDALVMASAARRGDRVLTTDQRDLERLQTCFPSVRLVPI